jgi:excisionase family DNA binding protein
MEHLTFDQLPQAVSTLICKLDRIEQLLSQSSLPAKQADDQLLTVQEAAEFLSLAVPTLYGFAQRREIPHNKRGKRLYFSKPELIHWIKTGRKKTNIEIQAEAEAELAALGRGVK